MSTEIKKADDELKDAIIELRVNSRELVYFTETGNPYTYEERQRITRQETNKFELQDTKIGRLLKEATWKN